MLPGGDAVTTRASRMTMLRYALIVCCGLLVAVALFVGERPSSLRSLESDVAAGRVHVVQVAGALGPRSTGYSFVELHWRRGLFRYVAEVVEARPRRAAPAADSRDGAPVITSRVGDRLARFQPGLRVVRVDRSGSYATSFGWRLPAWMGWATLILGLASLWLLVSGAQPWRATRWAWFWLMGLVPPLGVLAFLVLSGPTPPLAPPRQGGRRLTGGWAFLLAWLVAAFLHQSS